jgi:hypothetical protein
MSAQRLGRRIIYVPAIVIALSCSVKAQQNVGSVTGTVRDTSDALVPGASVTARQTSTGIENQTVSNGVGAYTFPSLTIGDYIITASKVGFATVQKTGIRVVSAEAVSLDFELTVGTVVQTTTVSASATVVDTTRTATGATRVVEEISNLPLANEGGARNALQFMRTLGFANFDNTNEDIVQTERGIIYGVGGAGNALYESFSIDGIKASLNLQQGMRDDGGPIPEDVAEFRLSTNPDAEYGGDLGVGLNFVMKSGTNQFHGSAFEYLRNSVLDARNFFAINRNPEKQNEFGATFGGPILKDRLFFFGSYDGYHFRQAATGQVTSLPDAKMRTGDFSEWLGPQVGTDVLGRPVFQGEIFDPATTRPDGHGGFLRDPFNFNNQLNVIDPSQLSSLSTTFQKGYPAPNLPGIGQNFTGANVPSPVDMHKIALKVDGQFSQNRLSFGYQGLPRKNQIYGALALDPTIGQTLAVYTHEYHFQVSYDRSLRPNLLFSFRVGVSRAPREIGPQGFPSATFGQTAGWTGVYTPETPSVSIQGGQSFGAPFRRISDPSVDIPVHADLAWSKGRHTAKFGAQYLYLNIVKRLAIGTAGNIAFANGETGLPAFPQTGLGYASFLLGDVDHASLATPVNDKESSRVWSFYGQDSWRATPKLTVNYGLRWEFSVGPWETYNRYGGFDPSIPNPGAGGIPGAVTFWGPGAGRNGRTRLLDGYYGALGPRLGIAYAWNPKTVTRAYFGIIYGDNAASDIGSGIGLGTFNTGWTASLTSLSTDSGVTPAFNWTNGWPTPLPNLPTLDPALQNGSSGTYVDTRTFGRPAYAEHLGFSVSRELPWGALLEAAYIGNLTHRLPQSGIPLNYLDPKYLSLGFTLSQSINSPEAQAAGIPIPYPGFTGSVQTALLPYPQYPGGVSTYYAPITNAYYHALETKLQKRFGNGLSMLVDFTVSKNLNSAQAVSAFYPRIHQFPGLDRPWQLAFSYTYDLPFGRGKRFLNTSNSLLNGVVGGWSIAGIQDYEAGLPINLSSWANPTGAPIRTPEVSCGNLDPSNPTRNQYLNFAAISQPAPFTLGSVLQLPNVRGCGYDNENISFMKDIPIREKIRVKFSANFFNTFNRHDWLQLNTNISSPSQFGRFGTSCTATTICNAASDPRFVQLALKIDF